MKRSHIVPEFGYTPIYDTKHRLHVLSTTSAMDPKPIQKGLRERLLCGKCEARLGGLERYACAVLRREGSVRWALRGRFWHVSGVDYARFKLFQLSVLWRAGVSTLLSFSDVHLGPHEARIRRMLVDGEPGSPEQFGCAMFLILLQGEVMNDMLMEPTTLKWDGYRVHRFVWGGMLWAHFGSGHGVHPQVRPMIVTPDGTMIVPQVDAASLDLMRGLAGDLRRLGKLCTGDAE